MADPMNETCAEERWIAHALVVREGKVLLLRRNDERYLGGHWDIPGGSVEPGEQAAEAAQREVVEEAGLIVTIRGELTRFANRDTEGRDILFRTVTFGCVEADVTSEVRLVDAEHSEFVWASYEQALDLPLVWHVRKTLDHARLVALLS